jgi:uncharacterized protein
MSIHTSRSKPWLVLFSCWLTLAVSSAWAQTEEEAERVAELTAAALNGEAEAQYNLGNMYDNGEGVPKDQAVARMWLTKAAEQGHANAQFYVGARFYSTRYSSIRPMWGSTEAEVPGNESAALAVIWLTKASEQGIADAQYMLGNMYNYAEGGIPQDGAAAVKWLTKAAEQGHDQAQADLAHKYDNGVDVPEDNATAVMWYTKAAEQGHSVALRYVGYMYAEGDGVPEDDASAVMWLTKAAEHPSSPSSVQFSLALMYANGEGVPEDNATAVMWYTKAAERGNVQAQTNLGYMYGNGEGVPENDVIAYMWYNLAAAKGNEIAKGNKDKITKIMTAADVSKAQELSRVCLAQYYENCGY